MLLNFVVFSLLMFAIVGAFAWCAGLALCGGLFARIVGFAGLWGLLNLAALLNANHGAVMRATVQFLTTWAQ